MIAIIETGGKQYTLKPGQSITVDRINAEVGTTLQLIDLLRSQPIDLTVREHMLGDKVVSRKFRNKTRSHKMMGHRQSETKLEWIENSSKSDSTKASKIKTDKKVTV